MLSPLGCTSMDCKMAASTVSMVEPITFVAGSLALILAVPMPTPVAFPAPAPLLTMVATLDGMESHVT